MRKLFLTFSTLFLSTAFILNPLLTAETENEYSTLSKFAPQACRGCERPDRGPPGPQGTQGVPGGFNHLFVDNDPNDEGVILTIAVGDAVSFNGTPVSSGTAITMSGDDTFIISQTGHYLVTFVAQADASLLSSVQFELNGVPVGPVASLIVDDGTLVLQAIIDVPTAPSTLQVVVSGFTLTLSGNPETISIVQLSTP